MRSLLLCAALLAAPLAAQVTPIPGSGCPGAPPCNVTGTPQLGTTICFDKQPPCPPGSLPFIIFGTEFLPPLPILPPLACSPTGAPCFLACNPVATFGLPRLCLRIPLNRALVGQCFCIQCGCVEQNPLGICLNLCQALRVCITP